MAIQRYKEEFGKTLEEIAKEIGKSKDYVSRLLSVLELPQEVIEDVQKNKSTKDVRALSEINAIAKKMKKLVMTNFEIENLQKSLYYGLLEHGREWLKREIKRKLSLLEEQEKEKSPIKIKKDKRRGLTINVRIPNLDDEKIKEI